MRIGGNAKREQAFAERYPWVRAEIEKVAADAAPATVPEQEKPQQQKQVVRPTKSGPFDFLMKGAEA